MQIYVRINSLYHRKKTVSNVDSLLRQTSLKTVYSIIIKEEERFRDLIGVEGACRCES